MAALTLGTGPCAGGCVAWGGTPAWRIDSARGSWSLHVAGRPDAAMMPGTWQDTPRGRRLTGTMTGGRFTLLATFGLCRPDGDRLGGESSHFATLTLPDGSVLRGCLSDGQRAGYIDSPRDRAR